MNTPVNLDQIDLTKSIQTRLSPDPETIDRYQESYHQKETLPEVVLFFDGTDYFVADGFHRVLAATYNGNKTIEADVRKGNQTDAMTFGLGCNDKHGLARTKADKRYAVELAAKHFPDYSHHMIADICKVSHTFVIDVRNSLRCKAEKEAKKTVGDGMTSKTSKAQQNRHSTGASTSSADNVPPQVEEDEPEVEYHQGWDGKRRPATVAKPRTVDAVGVQDTPSQPVTGRVVSTASEWDDEPAAPARDYHAILDELRTELKSMQKRLQPEKPDQAEVCKLILNWLNGKGI